MNISKVKENIIFTYIEYQGIWPESVYEGSQRYFEYLGSPLDHREALMALSNQLIS